MVCSTLDDRPMSQYNSHTMLSDIHKEGDKKLEASEVVGDYKEPVSSRYYKAVIHINSQLN